MHYLFSHCIKFKISSPVFLVWDSWNLDMLALCCIAAVIWAINLLMPDIHSDVCRSKVFSFMFPRWNSWHCINLSSWLFPLQRNSRRLLQNHSTGWCIMKSFFSSLILGSVMAEDLGTDAWPSSVTNIVSL